MDAGLNLPDVSALAAGQRAAQAAATSAASKGEAGAAKAAKEFEQLLASMLFKEMRRTLGDGFFGSGNGADIYDGWLDQHVGAALCEGPGLGLRVALERSFERRPATPEIPSAPSERKVES